MLYNYNQNSMRTLECDTLIIGGGIAGSSAAIASARNGSKTFLAEASGTLGGQATTGIVTPLGSAVSKSGESFGGLVEEIINKTSILTKKYVCADENEEDIYDVSPHMLKYTLLKLASDCSVNFLFHTVLCDVKTDNSKIISAILHDKSGFLEIRANTFIDASGDADMVYLSGDNYVLGSEKDVLKQLKNTSFNIAHDKISDYIEYPENLM